MTECLGCQKLEQDSTETITLISGVIVCSSCPAWRDECLQRHKEAKALLAMKLDNRRAKLAQIAGERGEATESRLKAEMLRLHKSMKTG